MARASTAESGHADGVAVLDHEAVHAQLARLLDSPHFRNSKRSQAFLRFVVQAALAGDQNSLKERGIGAAVFGREPAYDTAQDPIVRNAAIEVRKRLAQHYLEPEHAAELRIELPSGSYMPSFPAESGAVAPAVPRPKAHGSPLRWIAVAALAVLTAAVAFLWGTRRTPASDLEAFWEPLFRDGSAIQVSIGQPTRLYRFTGPRMEELNRLFGGGESDGVKGTKPPIAPDEVVWVAPEYLFLRDALAAFKVAAWIQSTGHASRLASVAQTNYSQLRHAPLVAIGAFNNAWSIRVTAELRFVFDYRRGCVSLHRRPTQSDERPVESGAAGEWRNERRLCDRDAGFRTDHGEDGDFSGRYRDVWHARGQRVRHGTDLSRGCAGRRAAGLAAQERAIRVGHENHRRDARATADAGRSILVTGPRQTRRFLLSVPVRRNRSDLRPPRRRLVQRWLLRHRPVQFHLTPTYTSDVPITDGSSWDRRSSSIKLIQAATCERLDSRRCRPRKPFRLSNGLRCEASSVAGGFFVLAAGHNSSVNLRSAVALDCDGRRRIERSRSND
jgi:hypothetical protein